MNYKKIIMILFGAFILGLFSWFLAFLFVDILNDFIDGSMSIVITSLAVLTIAHLWLSKYISRTENKIKWLRLLFTIFYLLGVFLFYIFISMTFNIGL